MKMKFTIGLLMIVILIITSFTVYADTFTLDPSMVEDYDPVEADPRVVDGAGKILGVIVFIAWAVAIAMIMIIGMKYMSSGAGSRAEVKSTLLPYVIGAILVASAASIFKFISSLGG